MKRTSLIGGELASDIRFLAELSLYGKFFVLPEYLFSRRFHETSSSWERGPEASKSEENWDRPARVLRPGADDPVGNIDELLASLWKFSMGRHPCADFLEGKGQVSIGILLTR